MERRTAAAMAPHRAAEFLAGRRALRSALAGAGVVVPGLSGTGGPPRLPDRYVGSISHSAGLAVAVAAHRDRYRAVGVDLELNGLPPSAAHLVLNREDREWLGTDRPGADARRLLAAFSAKESAYKAIDVLLRERTGGHRAGPALPGLRSLRLHPHARGFLVQPDGCLAPVATVRVRAVPGGVLTWAVVSERSAEPPVFDDPFDVDEEPFGWGLFDGSAPIPVATAPLAPTRSAPTRSAAARLDPALSERTRRPEEVR
ncbi:4'-phosphopantetheinyl transferase superfamily protein [Streptomyces sp. FH025]|uniref:4'-phosphopantetheinyl transferase family protein n=1 Tax=Streptomyces sp. FH025 TaxID=2815937 RepID=UPI001AA009FA|nr:4'-phosphopantetheinyl transferase superfamily protein [Streptomyces sp. FH025]MBO1416098.1 4'-phosphopantetheinyl transferase superfamily protein [Streptomyces sp. FH025]